MFLFVAKARNSFGDALLTGVVKLKSSIETLPTAPPPPGPDAWGREAPQLKLSISISPLCLASWLSPSMPSSLRNMSAATAAVYGRATIARVRTLGIDLSASPAKTGACTIDWDAGAVSFLPHAGDDELVAAAVVAEMTAIDVPLGWPDAFVEAVLAHRDGRGWPPVAMESPADRVPLRYRVTDLAALAAGARPLSVSSDLIGVAAMRGARLQHLLGAAGVPVDRSGVTGRVAEVYPAATLRGWGLVSSGYKGTANAAACRSLAGALAGQCGRLGAAAAAALEGCDDNRLDAFLCGLVARAVLTGQTTRPSSEQLDAARREGWIHLPTVGLAELVA